MKRITFTAFLYTLSMTCIAATTYTEGSWFLQGNGPQVESTTLDECKAKWKALPDPIKQRTVYCAQQLVTKVAPDQKPEPQPEPKPNPKLVKPDATNTGPRTTTLRPLESTRITSPGVYENFTATSQVSVTASNVTLRNFRITTADLYGIKVTGTNVLIEDGEISGMRSAAILGSNFTARRLHIFDSGSDGIKPYENVIIEDCYVHSLGSKPDSHADGVQMVRGGNVVIRRNHFDMPHDDPRYNNSQVIIIKTDDDNIDDVLIEDNWINGGGYSIQVRQSSKFGPPTDVRILGNRFGRGYNFGPMSLSGAPTVCGNVWEDDGKFLEKNGKCP